MITVDLLDGFTLDQKTMITASLNRWELVREQEDYIKGIAEIGEPKLIQAFVYADVIKIKLKFKRLWNPFSSEVAAQKNGIIYLNRKSFIQKSGVASLAGTLAHEYSHVIGYGHGFLPSKKRALSVPYVVGDLVCAIAKRFQ